MKKVAIVCAPGLGDGLIFMVLSHNFFLSGYEVTTFSNPLVELKNFFPEHTILPFPDKSHYFQIFSLFDQVIAADYSILAESIEWNNLCVLKESGFDRKKTMIENLAHLCRERFQLPYFSKHNGLTLSNVQFRKYPNRIIIHPTSLDDKKTWAKPKFLSLTEQLIKNEWDPVICVSPKERKDWENVISKKNISNTGGLDELLTFICQSGYMIGNDSGIGHLSSNIGIPTLTLFARRGYSNLWRPGWGPGRIVTPPDILIGSRLKQKYWKQVLSVRRVLHAFRQLALKFNTFGPIV